MISATGLGSGLDVESIVSQLMAIERRPLVQLQTRQVEFDVKLSAYGQLRSAIAALQAPLEKLADTAAYEAFSATSTDEEVFTATASGNAAEESHSIEVNALAQRHRLASMTFDGSDTVVGTGTLTISVGADAFDLEIDTTNSTVAGIRDAINGAPDNSGVKASVINVDGGSVLILTSSETGAANNIEVSVSGDGDGDDKDADGLSRLVYAETGGKKNKGKQNLTEIEPAQDAEFKVDGFAVTSASNEVADVIAGVTLKLVAEGSGTVTVERDTSNIASNVEELVSAYQSLHTTVTELRGGALSAESLLLSAESGIRQLFSEPVDGIEGGLSYIFELGLSFDKDGVLSLDDAKLSEMLETRFDDVVGFFTNGSNGFAERLDVFLDRYVQGGGAIDSRTDGLNRRSRSIDSQIERLEFRLSQTEARIRSDFTALDTLVSQLEVTSNFLLQQLTNLPFNGLDNQS